MVNRSALEKSRTRVHIPFKAIFRVSLVFIDFFLSLVSVHLCYVYIYIYIEREREREREREG